MDNSLKKGRITNYSNKIGLFDSEKQTFINSTGGVVLSFPFKDCVLEGGMSSEEDGREEKFFHEILDRTDIDVLREPKVLTKFEKIDRDGIHSINSSDDIDFWDKDGNLQENLLIKGNNLIALYSLRQKLAGKVKLIYIDPPYNTGSDGFRYNDNFNHSTWLVFMRNRLEIARELLRDDGIILVQCDDNEQAYLKILLDEVFQRENFINNIVVKMSPEGGMKTTHKERTIIKVKEYILAYAKNNNLIALNPQYIERSEYNTEYEWIVENKEEHPSKWKISRLYEYLNTNYGLVIKNDLSNLELKNPEIKNILITLADKIWYRTRLPEGVTEKLINNFNEVIEYQEGNYGYKGRRMSFLSKTLQPIRKNGKLEKTFVTILGDLYTDISIFKIFNQGGVDFKNGKKPEDLISRLIALTTDVGDLILDFHLGSGTTAAVAHKMDRKWIGIEQMDYIEELAKKRLINVIKRDRGGISSDYNWQGGGSFVYMELKAYNIEFIDRIQSAKTKEELHGVYVEMASNAFLQFWFDRRNWEKDENYRALTLEEQKGKLRELLDLNQLYLNVGDMHDSRHQVSELEKALTEKFYGKQ